MTTGRYLHTATLLPSGRVLVAGGFSAETESSAELYVSLSNGTACSAGSDCTSGNCMDGYCCNTACAGACDYCNLAGSLGTCSLAPAGDPGAPSCAPYTCQSSVSCPTSCATDAQCTSANYCVSGACVARSANGATCTAGDQCTSNNCVDGVCCSSACAGQCEACNVAGAVGTCSGVVGAPHGTRAACAGTGTCAATCNGSDRLSCGAFPGVGIVCGAASCAAGTETSTTYCNGLGACAATTTTSCGAYVCGGSACRSSCGTSADCATGYACKSGVCVTKGDLGTLCGGDAECTSGHCTPASSSTSVCCTVAACASGSYCADRGAGSAVGTCLAKLGEKCGATSDCLSGFCADGVCCNSACAGQCETCDVPGAAGTCNGINGKPRGARPACSDGAGDVCAALACSGADDRTKCVAFANGPGTECAPASCKVDHASSASSCDGKGKCVAGASTPCGDYGCDATTCKTRCAVDGDCATGLRCDTPSKRCVAPTATCSTDGTSSLSADRATTTSCAPFRCNLVSGACFTACAANDQCAGGLSCVAGACVSPDAGVPSDTGALAETPPTASSGGCGLSRRAELPAGGVSLAAIALAGLLMRRRRRAMR